VKRVEVAPGLSFPAAELATEVVASLGNRGGGKSNGAAVIVEGLLRADIPVVVLDYVGIWPSLRLRADGKTPSDHAIPILGGPHGDVALTASAGTVVAEALAERHSSAVLDVSGFSKGDRSRFAADFAEAFFRAKKRHPGPVQLVLEEAQRFIPQKLFHGLERMLGAFQEVAEVGRNYGIGLHLISQRPQKIDKDVLNLADTLFAYRTIGVLERKAVAEWVQEKGAEGRQSVHDELPGLARGQAVVWCPSRQLYGTYQVRKKSTYDAGATPLESRSSMKPRPLDIGELEVAMASVVEEAKASDPRALREEVARLRRELDDVKVVVAPTVSVGELDSLRSKVVNLSDVVRELELGSAAQLKKVGEVVAACFEEVDALRGAARSTEGAREPRRAHPSTEASAARTHSVAPAVPVVGALSKCAAAILTVLARRGKASASQLAVLSGYSVKSSGFGIALRYLLVVGFATRPGAAYAVTEAGRLRAGEGGPPQGGEALVQHWLGRLSTCESALLRVLLRERKISREELARESGYSPLSSGFSGAISSLLSLELARSPEPGILELSEEWNS